MKWRFSAIALLLLVSMTGCIYDYSPEEISTKVADNTVVVIDGDIAERLLLYMMYIFQKPI